MPVCRYHKDRPGIGVCMRCRSVICPACCTRVDGVNHCHACLQKLARKAAPAGHGPGSRVAAVALLAVAWMFLFGLLWAVQGSWRP